MAIHPWHGLWGFKPLGILYINNYIKSQEIAQMTIIIGQIKVSASKKSEQT